MPASHSRLPLPPPLFSTLFAKDGALDSFFTQYLRPYVTTGTGPWRVHPAGDLSPPIDEPAALSFQNAAMIRDAFFGSGGTEPQVRFALVPIAFDTTTKRVTLSVDGVQRSYEAGASATLDPIEWPGPAGEGSASLVFDPAGDGPALEQTGPWALFRLLRGAQVQSTGNERVLRVTFAQGERRAMFDLSTQSLHNPFRASLLDHFTCPALHP
jgi:type VI secretion system protein ImpL